MPGGVFGVHRAISGRIFRALGPSAAPGRVMHDTIARGSYFGVRAGLAVAGRLAGEAYARRLAESGVPVVARRFDDLIHGFANLRQTSGRFQEALFEVVGTLRAGLALGE